MTPSGRASAVIAWRPWSPAAFAEARECGKPILLSISTAWSEGSREMDRATYAEPAVAAAVAEACVAVRVDADERPDIAERYALGGFPTTAFLTADGFVLGGGTYIDAETLRTSLPRVIEANGRHAGGSPTSLRREVSPQTDEALGRALAALFDSIYGGIGGAPRFPHTAAVHWALDVYADSADPLMLERATCALDAMGWSELYDEAEGGFYRCCRHADWTAPEREKLLPVNAALLELYLRAGAQTATERWLGRAADTLAFIQHRLRRQDGAWRLSSSAGPSRVFSDANGAAVSAMLHAARVFGDDQLARQALGAFEHVLLASYKPGAGVAHFGGGPRGFLNDQVAMAAAALDAYEVTGDVAYRMMAEELAHVIHGTCWDEANGGCYDRDPVAFADEPGGASVPLKPFVLNCQAAVVFRRLADATAEERFADRAVRTLAAVASCAAAQGADVAHYLTARRAVLR